MRLLLAFALSAALIFGCGDESGVNSGQGGSGGSGGIAGEGGTGGTRAADGGPSSYVFVSPIPPCLEGVASNYRVEAVLGGAGILIPSFPECVGLPVGEDATITCPIDEASLDYRIIIIRGGGTIPDGARTELDASGAFDACSGFLLRDVDPPTGEVIADVFVSPTPPCESGVPSDYTVEVFVDGATDPVVVTGNFPGCTGQIDSQDNTITCPNDAASISYSLMVEAGDDYGVSINGEWETCTAFLAR
jgi:hypothetical protein